MSKIIGRDREISEINRIYESGKSEFVAVYGRRRVGKTFLVDEALKGKITFRHAGLSPVEKNSQANNLKAQLKHFYFSLKTQGLKVKKCPASWIEAFYMLSQLLENIDDGNRQVVFLDELPWMDTPRSGFITAFEGFWNTWACHRDNMFLIVCGSANSWMLDNLVNSHGGLYGRTTFEIKLKPFRLRECELYFEANGIKMSRYDVAQSYMILGGIPYYLGYFKKCFSLAQNIDQLFFAENAKLNDEYDRLFASVFSKPDEMKRIVRTLSERHSGFTRQEINSKNDFQDGGAVTKMLKALLASDFIETYIPFGDGSRNEHYKLSDPFCLFYLKFVHGQTGVDPAFWTNNVGLQRISSWRGIAFEEVCFRHISQIKKALGISGVASEQSVWSVRGDNEKDGAQIDLIINRKDNVVNLCEAKFYNEDFAVDKNYYLKLIHRQNMIGELIPRRSVTHNVLITTFGLTYNSYGSVFQNVITLDDLFE